MTYVEIAKYQFNHPFDGRAWIDVTPEDKYRILGAKGIEDETVSEHVDEEGVGYEGVVFHILLIAAMEGEL